MNDWDDVFDDDENPYTIIIKELRRSNDFFKLLSETLKSEYFKKQAEKVSYNLKDIEEYILSCNDKQLNELLDRIDEI